MAATNRNSAAKARKTELQAKALEMRRMGMGYAEIARQLTVSLSTAHGYVSGALDEVRAQIKADAIDIQAEELSRLDAMLRGLWADARKGNVAAIDRVLKIMERRARMLGLDAAVKLAHGGDPAAPPIEHQHAHALTDADLERIAGAGRG